jgi:hypothetical protein
MPFKSISPLLLIVLILGLHSRMTYSWTLCEISHNVGCTPVYPTHTETRAQAGSSFGVFGCKQTITASLDMADPSQVHRSVFRASQARGGGLQIRPSPPKNQVSWTFANHVRTFCYANGQVRRDGNSTVNAPQHQAGASPLHHDVGEG